MATVTLFSDESQDGYVGIEAVTNECIVYVRGTFDGAVVEVKAADLNDEGDAVPIDVSMAQHTVFRQPKCVRVDGLGTYYLVATIKNAGPNTMLTCVAVN